MANKPGTESTRAQGRPESPNPLRSDARPPSRLEHADNTVPKTEEHPGQEPTFLTFRIKSGRKWHSVFPVSLLGKKVSHYQNGKNYTFAQNRWLA